jgi:tRNA(Ile)-lysidine synthase
MSQKNLNVPNKTHKRLLDKLKDKRTFQIYQQFEAQLDINTNFIVAVSGGPDSLALSFLAKIYSIKKSLNAKYFIVDHKLRKDSTSEAKFVKKKLKDYSIDLNILTWYGKKPNKNIQSVARNKRYKLLTEKAKKFKIKNILLGHHLDDLFENFFIRILRGSGLNGLVSLDKETQNNQVNLIRPLLKFEKKDLVYISDYIFGSYVSDPSNENDKFKRVKIRNFLKQLEAEGLDKKKFFLTIRNLKFANETIKFYTKNNLYNNVTFLEKKNIVILKIFFFQHSNEVVFRSFNEVIKLVGKKYYPVRGKKIEKIIQSINTNVTLKVTLGGCLIRKVNQTVIISKE